MISIEELHGKKALETFIRFPFELYKGNKYWVPPIIADELDFFDPEINPVFEHAEARYFIAKKEQKIVGRIAAMVNRLEINEQSVPKMRFGWFDFIDDYEVSKALLDEVVAIGKREQLSFIEGPVGFSNMDKVGVLTEGFEHIGTMISWYNHEYYEKHYIKYGLEPEKKYLESEFLISNVDANQIAKFSDLIQKRYQLRLQDFRKTSEVLGAADQMFDLFNESYAKLPSFVPISERQKEYFKKKYLTFINPEYIKFVFDSDGKMVAFAITMPSFSKALQRANGKLSLLGILHLLWAKRYSKTAILYLIGVLPEYQNKGVTSLLFASLKTEYDKRGVQIAHRTPELEDNMAIQRLWKDFNPYVTQKRATYKKEI